MGMHIPKIIFILKKLEYVLVYFPMETKDNYTFCSQDDHIHKYLIMYMTSYFYVKKKEVDV